jgi:hypothetical protein
VGGRSSEDRRGPRWGPSSATSWRRRTPFHMRSDRRQASRRPEKHLPDGGRNPLLANLGDLWDLWSQGGRLHPGPRFGTIRPQEPPRVLRPGVQPGFDRGPGFPGARPITMFLLDLGATRSTKAANSSSSRPGPPPYRRLWNLPLASSHLILADPSTTGRATVKRRGFHERGTGRPRVSADGLLRPLPRETRAVSRRPRHGGRISGVKLFSRAASGDRFWRDPGKHAEVGHFLEANRSRQRHAAAERPSGEPLKQVQSRGAWR